MLLLSQVDSQIVLLLLVFIHLFIVMAALALMMIKCLVKTGPDQAIVRTGVGGTKVSFDSAMVVPVLHEVDRINISSQTLSYERTGDWALQFKCGTQAELVADMMVRVNKEERDVIHSVQMLGCETINDREKLTEYFSSMFNDSIETLAGKFEYTNFVSDKDVFREELLVHIGSDLSGMVLEDICLHHLRKV